MDEFTFPKLNSHKLAEFVGILLGDGCIGVYPCKSSRGVRPQYRIKISLDAVVDASYISYVGDLIKDLFNICPVIRYRKNENTCDILIFRRQVWDFLTQQVGVKVSPKWGRAEIPGQYQCPDFERDVVRGYFDTDGCVVITENNGIVYPRLEMKVCPSPMQEQFVQILRNNNFNVRVSLLDKKKIRIQMNGKRELRKWVDMIGFMNPKHTQKSAYFLDA